MTYNHEKFIKQAIDGIIMQKTNFSIEVIIGDDFSTDNTIDIIKNYKTNKKIDIRILKRTKGDTYWKNRQKYGRLYNFIDIINNCKGKYIALLDGDDYWSDPLKLQKQVDFLETHPSYSATCHNVLQKNEITSSQKMMKQELKETDISIQKLANKNAIVTLSLVFKNDENIIKHFKSFIKRYPQTPVGDYVLNLFLAQTGKIRYFPEMLGVYRVHNANIFSSTLYNDEKRISTCISMINLIEILKKQFNSKDLTVKFNQQQKEYLEELYRFRIKYKRKKNIRDLFLIDKKLLLSPIFKKNSFRVILSIIYELIFLEVKFFVKRIF